MPEIIVIYEFMACDRVFGWNPLGKFVWWWATPRNYLLWSDEHRFKCFHVWLWRKWKKRFSETKTTNLSIKQFSNCDPLKTEDNIRFIGTFLNSHRGWNFSASIFLRLPRRQQKKSQVFWTPSSVYIRLFMLVVFSSLTIILKDPILTRVQEKKSCEASRVAKW